MGKRNREKRNAKAKQRARQRRGPTQPRGYGGYTDDCDCPDCRGADQASPVETVAGTIVAAAIDHSRDGTAAYDCAAELSGGRDGVSEPLLGQAVDLVLRRALGRVWELGWLPVDVWQLARRQLDATAAALTIDAIAAEHAQYAPATVHERWSAQLGELDASVWWDTAHPHLGQWAARRGLDIRSALATAVRLLAVLMAVPELPRILPLPGRATRRSPAAGVDQKVLARVRALLAKAESTDFAEEAEALSAKAQELMNRHAFERALLDADAHLPQRATSRRIWLDAPYVEGKAHLVALIAEANRSRAVYHSKIGFVSLVGEELDLEIVELLTTSLLVQATRAMVAQGSQISRDGTSRTRSFRQSFLAGYATRIGERLRSAEASPQDLVEDPRLLPVLADRSKAVDDAFEEMFAGSLVSKSTSVTNGSGWNAGVAAADLATLDLERTAVRA